MEQRILGCDTETNGLEYRKHQLLQVQLCTRENEVYIVRRPTVKSKYLRKLFMDLNDSVEFVFHHAGFDVRFLRWHLALPKFWFSCTKILSKIVELPQKSSLGPVTQRVVGVKRDKGQALSDWDVEQLSDEQITYAAEDVLYLIGIYDKLYGALEDNAPLYFEATDVLEGIIQLELKGRADLLTYADSPEETAKLMNDWKLKTTKKGK